MSMLAKKASVARLRRTITVKTKARITERNRPAVQIVPPSKVKPHCQKDRDAGTHRHSPTHPLTHSQKTIEILLIMFFLYFL
jgi:hypothetical protein